MTEQVFRIYVKTEDMKTFGALGSGGTVVGNLIYALHWWDVESANVAFNEITTKCPEYQWQLRNTSNKIIRKFNN